MCSLPADESGRILDRLAGLEQVIAPESVRQSLLDAGRVNRRSCRLTHEVTLWVVLAMGLLTDLPIRQVFKHSRRLRAQIGEDGSAMAEDTPERSSLCVARRRLGVAPWPVFFAQSSGPWRRPKPAVLFIVAFCWWASMAVSTTFLTRWPTPRRLAGHRAATEARGPSLKFAS